MFGGPSEAEQKDYAAHHRISEVLGEAELGSKEWRRLHYRYTAPEADNRIRVELKPLQPGTLWIDDVQFRDAR